MGKRFGLIQGCIVAIQRFLGLYIYTPNIYNGRKHIPILATNLEGKVWKVSKGLVCKKIKNESFGSSPGANHENFSWLGPFDMKDTLWSSCFGQAA
jgi:hypothetical protein